MDDGCGGWLRNDPFPCSRYDDMEVVMGPVSGRRVVVVVVVTRSRSTAMLIWRLVVELEEERLKGGEIVYIKQSDVNVIKASGRFC